MKTVTINKIIKGNAALTPESAIQLEHALAISAKSWNGLEAAYQLQLLICNDLRNVAAERIRPRCQPNRRFKCRSSMGLGQPSMHTKAG